MYEFLEFREKRKKRSGSSDAVFYWQHRRS